MSFDIFCIAYKDGERAVGDAGAALAVLRSHDLNRNEMEGFVAFEFSDGSHVELCADGVAGGQEPFDGGMFHLTGSSWTLTVMQFIYDFAAAGRLIIFPQHPARALLPFEELRADVPPGFLLNPQPIVVRNGHELGLAISERADNQPAQSESRVEGNALD